MKVGMSGVHTGWLHARILSRVSKGEKHRWPTRVEHKPCAKEEELTWIQRATRFGNTPKCPSRVRGAKKKRNTSLTGLHTRVRHMPCDQAVCAGRRT